MSLSVDGVWKAGVWATTVWADGVWQEGLTTETITYSGGWGQTYRKRRKRLEIEPEAEAVIERIVEAVAQPDTTQEDLELALRLALLTSEIKYRSIYLKIALYEFEQIRREHESAMEEEAAVVLMMLH